MNGNADVVIVSTTTTTDDLGNSTATTTERPWSGCAVAPRYANESTDPRVPPVIIGVTVYGPATDLDSDDRLRIDGVLYDVDGAPGHWKSPFTDWDAGLEVPAKRAAAV